MVVARGELWWIDFGIPRGSAPGFRRPGVIVSYDPFNASALQSIVAVAVSTSMRLARAPGNVVVVAGTGGLASDSVVNVAQIATVDRMDLDERIGALPAHLLAKVDDGLRLSLAL